MNKKELKDKIAAVIASDNTVEYFRSVAHEVFASDENDMKNRSAAKLDLNGGEVTLDAVVIACFQKQPNTTVAIAVNAYNEHGDLVGKAHTVGFSKVCWPDEFNFRVGFERALGKAIGEAARMLLG